MSSSDAQDYFRDISGDLSCRQVIHTNQLSTLFPQRWLPAVQARLNAGPTSTGESVTMETPL